MILILANNRFWHWNIFDCGFATHCFKNILSKIVPISSLIIFDVKNSINIAIQVNGKLRAAIEVDINKPKEEILKLSKENSNVKSFLDNKEIIREIYIPGKLVNFVIK